MRRMSRDEARKAILAGEIFPELLTVEGLLNLDGCTGLISLPQGLTVGGSLYLAGCTGLTSLPQGLTVEGSLNLYGCSGLTSLPQGLTVGSWLDLGGCTGLTSLPQGLKCGSLSLDGCSLARSEVWIDASLPETVVASLPGRRLSEVFSHPLLKDCPIMKLIITSAKVDEDGDLVLYTDGNPLDHLSLPIAVGEPT